MHLPHPTAVATTATFSSGPSSCVRIREGARSRAGGARGGWETRARADAAESTRRARRHPAALRGDAHPTEAVRRAALPARTASPANAAPARSAASFGRRRPRLLTILSQNTQTRTHPHVSYFPLLFIRYWSSLLLIYCSFCCCCCCCCFYSSVLECYIL